MRSLRRGLVLWLLGMIVLASAAWGQKPNVIVILADDLGYGDVSCYNPAGKIRTPGIDRLAREGMRFTDAHTGSSVCTPTRYGLLTGRYAWRTRLQSGVLDGYSPALIEKGRMTVASMMREQGYKTACIGKWHLGWTWARGGALLDDKKDPKMWGVDWGKAVEGGPTAVGFDYFFGIPASLDMPPFVYVENDRVTNRPTVEKKWLRAGPAAEDFEAVDVLPKFTRKAVEWIEKRAGDGAPFFLHLALNSPHTPIVPGKEFAGKSGIGDYGDFVVQTDDAVGKVLDVLEKTGLAKNTLVIFTSDNGCSPAAGVVELRKQGHEPSGPLRGLKADIWEGGHRVPFVARWPGKVAAGATSGETICLTDMLATCAAIVGARLPENAGEDSYNVLPALLGEKKEGGIREATVHHSIDGRFAIRQGAWKLALCPGSGGWASPKDAEAERRGLPAVQLYNLEDDLGEIRNLATERPEMVDRLTKLLEKYVAVGRSTPGLQQRNDVPVAIRRAPATTRPELRRSR